MSGGKACTVYQYAVISSDASGNIATSSGQTFTTTGCAADATPSAATSTSVTVSAAATSTLADSGRTLTVSTPANFTATSSSVVIQIKGLSSDSVLGSIGKPSSSLASAASIVFDVTALLNDSTTLDSFDAPVTISYTYTNADISGVNESSLAMYHYHDGSWIKLTGCNVDTAANTITCDTPSFSTFAIFGTPLASSASTQGGGGLPWCSGPSAPGMGRVASWRRMRGRNRVGLGGALPVLPVHRQLRYGSQGPDVQALQKFLNCAGYPLGASGPGSPGHETVYFSDRTLKSLNEFQEAYAASILAPIGATAATGIFADHSQKTAYGLMK